MINNKPTNLNKHHTEETYNFEKEIKNRMTWLKNQLENAKKLKNLEDYCNLSLKLYEKGYSALDLMNVIEKMSIDETYKYQLLLTINKIKREFRNEKLLIMFILNFIFIRSSPDLENLSFI
jgi:hypothetical protein